MGRRRALPLGSHAAGIGGVMAAMLVEQASTLRAGLAILDPVSLSGEDAARLAHALALTEKACAAAKARAGARAAECRSHESEGFADPTEWLARMSGSTRGAAQAALETT